MIRAFPSTARRAVEGRDEGVCAGCGFDAGQAHRVLRSLYAKAFSGRDRYGMEKRGTLYGQYRDAWETLVDLWHPPSVWSRKNGIRVRPQVYTVAGRVDSWVEPHLWEADHIVPVVEGGGGCGLENYRTLCIHCHRDATRDLRKRMSARAKLASSPGAGNV